MVEFALEQIDGRCGERVDEADARERYQYTFGAWLMEKPLKDHADAMAVNQLFTTAEALRSEALASDEKGATKDQLKEFGLVSAETRVTFAGGAKPVEVLFGK